MLDVLTIETKHNPNFCRHPQEIGGADERLGSEKTGTRGLPCYRRSEY